MEDLSIMRSVLLLILPLMTGFKDVSGVKGCKEGWVDFTCKYPRNTPTNKSVDVVKDEQTVIIQSTKMNEWENKDQKFSVFHDTNNKNLRVLIKQLQHDDYGEYECLQSDNNSDYKEKSDSKRKPDSKEKSDSKRKPNSKEKPNSKRKPNSKEKSDSSEEEEVNLEEVDCQEHVILTEYRTAETTVSCDCSECKSKVKFLCKDTGSICEDILKSPQTSNGTFTLTGTDRGFNISIRDVSSQHEGVYWCGLEDEDGSHRASLRRIELKVEVPATTSPPSVISSASTHPVTPSTQSFKEPAGRDGGSWLTVIIPVVCVALLVLLLILVLGYKRFRRSNNTRNEDQNNEDRAYDEIQERPQEPGSGTALQTIYVKASAPTNPPASQCYSTVDFPTAPGEAAGDTYSTVTDDPCPDYSTVDHPSRLPEDLFYSTVNNPQQL